jgi:hypothetical protein
MASHQECQSRPEGRTQHDNDGTLDYAEHETRTGGEQHPWQYHHHHRRHDKDKEQGRPGALGIKPPQQAQHLFLGVEMDQQGE